MAPKTTLNAKNLESLGVERLAQLLIEISTGSAAAKRKLRLALAAAQSPREAAREITKRLTSIARARGFIDWKNRKKPATSSVRTPGNIWLRQRSDESATLLGRVVTGADFRAIKLERLA